MRCGLRWIGPLVGTAWLAWTGSAHAEGRTSALSWVRLPGSESCIAAAELSARVEKRLGRPVFASPSVADVEIEGRIEVRTKPAGFRAVVNGTRHDGSAIGTRELSIDGSNCRAIDESVVLVIALLIDPDAALGDRPPPAPPAPAPTPAPATPPASPPVVTREIIHERVFVEQPSAPASPWFIEPSLAASMAFGRLPATAPGAALTVRVGRGMVGLEGALAAAPGVSVNPVAASTERVSYSLIEGGLSLCPLIPMGERLAFGGCAGLRVGDVRSRGENFSPSVAVDRVLIDGAAAGRARLYVTRALFLSATATVLFPFVRQRTTATNSAGQVVTLDEQSAVAGEVALGIGVRFTP